MTSRVLLLVVLSTLPVLCSPVSLNIWYEFSFDAEGVNALGCVPEPITGACVPSDGGNSVFAGPPAWTVDLPFPAMLIVTDAFRYGDAFEVYDNGVLVFITPTVPDTGGGCGSDPDFCVTDLESSHGFALLAPGLHAIEMVPYQMAPEIGAGYFQIMGVPEPGTRMLIGLGLGIALLHRRLRGRGPGLV